MIEDIACSLDQAITIFRYAARNVGRMMRRALVLPPQKQIDTNGDASWNDLPWADVSKGRQTKLPDFAHQFAAIASEINNLHHTVQRHSSQQWKRRKRRIDSL